MDNEPDPNDLTQFVQSMLNDMQGRFTTMTTEVLDRIDQMSDRIDGLEKSINDLLTQAGLDEEADKKTEEQENTPPTADQ